MSLTAPDSFATSLSAGELAAFNLLCSATYSTAGKQAFLGIQPIIDRYNCWVFGVTTTVDNVAPFWLQDNLSTICWSAEARAVFLQRHELQKWQLQIVKALPLCNTSNIVQFNILEMGEPESQIIDYPNEHKKIQTWTSTINFHLYIYTGGKTNEESSSSSSSES